MGKVIIGMYILYDFYNYFILDVEFSLVYKAHIVLPEFWVSFLWWYAIVKLFLAQFFGKIHNIDVLKVSQVV